MQALGPDYVRSAEDHDALLGLGEAISVLAHRAPFLGCRLLDVSLLRPIGPSEEAFEELAFLVEVLNGVGMVGAWTIHEFVKMVRQSLLGLLRRAIGRGDQRRAIRPMSIFFVFLALLRGGAFIPVHALGFELVLASAKDRSDRLLARGVVGGDIE